MIATKMVGQTGAVVSSLDIGPSGCLVAVNDCQGLLADSPVVFLENLLFLSPLIIALTQNG